MASGRISIDTPNDYASQNSTFAPWMRCLFTVRHAAAYCGMLQYGEAKTTQHAARTAPQRNPTHPV